MPYSSGFLIYRLFTCNYYVTSHVGFFECIKYCCHVIVLHAGLKKNLNY